MLNGIKNSPVGNSLAGVQLAIVRDIKRNTGIYRSFLIGFPSQHK
jgi:hypothetical protein